MMMRKTCAMLFAWVAFSAAFAQGAEWYASPAGSDTATGTTAEAPLTFDAALEKAVDGDQIILAAGEYPVGMTYDITNGITITGAGIDQTIFVPATDLPENHQYTRCFTLTHADSILEKVTVKKARHDPEFQKGMAVLVVDGTLRNCRVTESYHKLNLGFFTFGTVAIMGPSGLVTHCIIDHNVNDHNGAGGGVYMEKGILENSLIYANQSAANGSGVCYAGGLVRNCTIVGNTSIGSNGSGLYWFQNGTAEICLQNLIVDGNSAPGDTGPGSPEWCGNQGQMDAKTSHCFFGHGKAIGQDRVTGTIAFTDPEKDDYTLTAGSCAVNKGAFYDGMAATDLLGKERVSGPAVDLGCYEFDQNAPMCGFAVEPSVLFGGESIVFTSSVFGAPDPDALIYDWTLTSQNGAQPLQFAGAMVTCRVDQTGWYDITLLVTDNGDFKVTASKTKAIHVAPRDLYLTASAEATPVYPWETPETASTNLQELLPEAIDGATIHAAAGEYKLTDEAVLDRAITLKGAGIDQTICIPAEEMTQRLFQLNHPAAVVEGLTVKGAKLAGERQYGDGVLIGAHGGTLRNCRVTQCKSPEYLHNGAVALQGENGLIDRCIIDCNTNMLMSIAGGVYISAGRLENSLIYGNEVGWDGGGLYYAGGVVRNCTIADNIAHRQGSGVFCQESGPAGICIANVLFSGNKGPDDTSSVLNIEFASGKVDQEAFAAKVSHCLFADSDPFGENARTGDPLFLDAANGDYHISRDSPAHDTGLFEEGMEQETDLEGNPRVDRKQLVDIGCYETPYVRLGTTLILR